MSVPVGPGRKNYVLCASAPVTGLINVNLRPGVTNVTAGITTWFIFSRPINAIGKKFSSPILCQSLCTSVALYQSNANSVVLGTAF